MRLLASNLENREEDYVTLHNALESRGFALGSSWDYDHGYFDRELDDKQKVWLRIPFQVTRGTFDGDNPQSDAVVRIGKPFVLNHLYEEAMDEEAKLQVAGGLVNQFQTPVDKDAPVDEEWARRAEELLQETESALGAGRPL